MDNDQQRPMHPWALQVPVLPPNACAYPSPTSASPQSALTASPTSAHAMAPDAYPPWFGAMNAPLALDMNALSVHSDAPSPVVPPAHSQLPTPVSPPHGHPSVSTGGQTSDTHQATPQDLRLNTNFLYEEGPVIPRKRSFDEDNELSFSFEGASPIEGPEADEARFPEANAQLPARTAGARPASSHNFVFKLYQMIIDTKSSQYIQWNELGTSFIVSNVGEFSRAILGSHFKHSNFSSFVRQLNMYGFHKINRTPRSQRQHPDQQAWEFSHPRFLRDRPDLLDGIRRKALEADRTGAPTARGSAAGSGVSALPGLPAAQGAGAGELQLALARAQEDGARVRAELDAEKAKLAALAGVTRALYDAVSQAWPGAVGPFPAALLEPTPEHSAGALFAAPFVPPPPPPPLVAPAPHPFALRLGPGMLGGYGAGSTSGASASGSSVQSSPSAMTRAGSGSPDAFELGYAPGGALGLAPGLGALPAAKRARLESAPNLHGALPGGASHVPRLARARSDEAMHALGAWAIQPPSAQVPRIREDVVSIARSGRQGDAY